MDLKLLEIEIGCLELERICVKTRFYNYLDNI